jgi:hypothetical protein
MAQSLIPFGGCSLNAMNLSTRLMPRPSAEGRGLFSVITAGERLGSSPRFPLVAWLVLRIGKLGLTVLAAATLCSTISRLVAADPSVEVFTQNSTVTRAREGDTSLFPELPFRLSVTASGGYDDNVNTTTGGAGSAFTQENLTISKELRTARTQLSIVVGTGVVYDGPSTDVTGSLNVFLRHNVSERLTLAASVNAVYTKEPQFKTDLGPARRENHFSTADTLTASYTWYPRLSTDSSYQLAMVRYADHLVSVVQDLVEHTFGESLFYRWSPRTTLIAEYRFELVNYDSFPRDSSTHFALGGLDYQVSSRLNATLLGGATFRKFENAGNGAPTIDPNASASLNYAIGPSTSLNWTASYSIEEPDFAETLSRTTFRTRTGLQLRYQLTRRLTANLGLNYHHDVNAGLLASGSPGANSQEFTEDGFELVLRAYYAVTDRVSLDLGFTHEELDSKSPTGGYSRNLYTAGLAFHY